MDKKSVKQPKLRHFQPGSCGKTVETWWPGVKSDSLRPVALPIGLEGTIITMLRHLPSKKQQAEREFIRLMDS